MKLIRTLPAALTLLLTPLTVQSQSLLDRTPNVSGDWVGAPGTLYFHFVHRFVTSKAPERKVSNVPTFLLAAGLPKRLLAGFNYSTNSTLAPRFPNEWEAFARWQPLAGGLWRASRYRWASRLQQRRRRSRRRDFSCEEDRTGAIDSCRKRSFGSVRIRKPPIRPRQRRNHPTRPIPRACRRCHITHRQGFDRASRVERRSSLRNPADAAYDFYPRYECAGSHAARIVAWHEHNQVRFRVHDSTDSSPLFRKTLRVTAR